MEKPDKVRSLIWTELYRTGGGGSLSRMMSIARNLRDRGYTACNGSGYGSSFNEMIMSSATRDQAIKALSGTQYFNSIKISKPTPIHRDMWINNEKVVDMDEIADQTDLAKELKSRVAETVVSPTPPSMSQPSNPLLVSLDDQLPDPLLVAESKPDGSRSEGEEKAANDMIDSITSEIKTKIRKAAIRLHRLGGPFRSQTYLQKLMTGVNQAVTDAVKDEEQKIDKSGKGGKGDRERPARGGDSKPKDGKDGKDEKKKDDKKTMGEAISELASPAA